MERQYDIEKKILSVGFSDIPSTDAVLNEYKEVFGENGFFKQIRFFISEKKIPSVVCVVNDEDNDSFEKFLEGQTFSNVDKAIVSESDSWNEIGDFVASSEYDYVFFFEGKYEYARNFLFSMLYEIEKRKTDTCISGRNIIFSEEGEKCIQRDIDTFPLSKDIYSGEDLVTVSEKTNIVGSIGTAIFSRKLFQKEISLDCCNIFANANIGELYRRLLKCGMVSFIPDIRISYDIQNERMDDLIVDNERKVGIEKSITFFYTDKGEYYNLKPIADEAEKRGYATEFTTDLKKKCEIGVYCQHVCYPENSKYSVVLLHDMAQGHNRWPNLWELEPWDKFDIGILPGNYWASLWKKSSIHPYVNPRNGCYAMGYPKSDEVSGLVDSSEKEELKKKLGFKYEKTVLYAPSWENDEKEDDFIRALVSLPINLLIKQAPWPSSYQFVIDAINKMREMHEGKYDNVYYLEPTESIMKAMNLCDLIVSDESSVMTEGILMNKPSIAVYDWLIPDTYPSRFASTPFEYVVKCKKVELREYVERFVSGDEVFAQAIERGQYFYNNIGNCSKNIVDAIDYYTQGIDNDSFLKWKISNRYGNFLLRH